MDKKFCNRSVTGGLTGRLKLKQIQKINKLSDRSVTLITHNQGITEFSKKALTLLEKFS